MRGCAMTTKNARVITTLAAISDASLGSATFPYVAANARTVEECGSGGEQYVSNQTGKVGILQC